MAIISLVFWGPSYPYLPCFSAIQSTWGSYPYSSILWKKKKIVWFAFVQDFLSKFVVNCSHCSESQNLGTPTTISFLHFVSTEFMVYTFIVVF